ncbi:MAG: DUF3570 domain-containing protein [Methyloglobulus sp.]|nr:DUF3570 domain-containing protein [Methyloglobulus sp.]
MTFRLKKNCQATGNYTDLAPSPKPASTCGSRALTAAALLLPGLVQEAALAADGDSVNFQYSHYQEGKRDIYAPSQQTPSLNATVKMPTQLNPIEVDSLHGSARVSLTERIKFAFNYLQDTWSGATPIGTAPTVSDNERLKYYASNPITSEPVSPIVGASPLGSPQNHFFIDHQGNLRVGNFDSNTGLVTPGRINNQLTHVLVSASPETRQQGDFKLSYDWDEASLSLGGGISVENDYESRFGNLGLRLDFNQKQTVFNLGLSYTNSDTRATLDQTSLSWINRENYLTAPGGKDPVTGVPLYRHLPGVLAHIDYQYEKDAKGDYKRTGAILTGNRQDWGVTLGLSQVLGKNALLEAGMGYTRSTGYMANPYKQVYECDGQLSQDSALPPLYYCAASLLEKRPGERNQFNWDLGYRHYIEALDAALHLDYRFAHDDWGIHAHTFSADWVQPLGAGWTLTPNVRYYSQSGAEFYTPFITRMLSYDPNTGSPIYDRELPSSYSSDQRLSGFGALSGGLTIAKQFARGIQLETGFEYYTHQGGLKLGGGGEQGFADYDYWVANAALKVNLEAMGGHIGGHTGHHAQHAALPAGVMFGHTLAKAGDFMAGYRYMRNDQAGRTLLGQQIAGAGDIIANGCTVGRTCSNAPKTMAMNMHMLDLMFAPTDWLTLMLMPQWLDMDMELDPLVTKLSKHTHNTGDHSHQSGGIGDTGVYALFKLFDRPSHQLNLSLGGTAPTGDVDARLRKRTASPENGQYLHYGMQLGSGTWDFKPALTYIGQTGAFLWGAQATGTVRLESKNESNFAFGDLFQGSAWGGYRWTDWLSTTVRGVYTTQGRIKGEFNPVINQLSNKPIFSDHIGPFDFPQNYGGRFWDLGLGVNVSIPHGAFAGNSLMFEWLQPVYTDYNGYQLNRDYAVNFTWSYGF